MNSLELYYNAGSDIIGIGSILSAAYCCAIWIKPFLNHRKTAWIAGCAYAVTLLALKFMPWYIDNMLAYGAGILIVFLVMSLFDRKYYLQKLFLVITFFCLRWQTYSIIVYINNEINILIYQFFPPKSNLGYFLYHTVFLVFSYVILFFSFLYNAVKCILWSYGQKREHMDSREFLLLSMPSLLGVVSYGVVRYYSSIYERDVGKSVFDLYGSHDLILSLFTLLSFAVIVVTTYVFRQWKDKQEEDRQREIFSAQMANLQNHIRETEQLYRDMRSLRHDMGNHLMTLKQLYEQGEYNAAQQYTDKLGIEMAKTVFDINSGNPVTDVILSGRKKEMDEKDISFICDFHYPMTETVDSFDISIILNNALSNAIEAIEREKDGAEESRNPARIFLSSDRRKNMYLIEIANSYRGTLEIDKTSGLPHTSKDSGSHGFGLPAIRHAAQKYLGDIEITQENREGDAYFVLRVILQLPEDNGISLDENT